MKRRTFFASLVACPVVVAASVTTDPRLTYRNRGSFVRTQTTYVNPSTGVVTDWTDESSWRLANPGIDWAVRPGSRH